MRGHKPLNYHRCYHLLLPLHSPSVPLRYWSRSSGLSRPSPQRALLLGWSGWTLWQYTWIYRYCRFGRGSIECLFIRSNYSKQPKICLANQAIYVIRENMKRTIGNAKANDPIIYTPLEPNTDRYQWRTIFQSIIRQDCLSFFLFAKKGVERKSSQQLIFFSPSIESCFFFISALKDGWKSILRAAYALTSAQS